MQARATVVEHHIGWLAVDRLVIRLVGLDEFLEPFGPRFIALCVSFQVAPAQLGEIIARFCAVGRHNSDRSW